mgnify:CR=1 FL=1
MRAHDFGDYGGRPNFDFEIEDCVVECECMFCGDLLQVEQDTEARELAEAGWTYDGGERYCCAACQHKRTAV